MRSSPNTPSSSSGCMTLCTTKKSISRRGKRSALSGYFNKEPGFHNLAKERPYISKSNQSINETKDSELSICQCFSSIKEVETCFSIKNKLSSSKNLFNLSHLRIFFDYS